MQQVQLKPRASGITALLLAAACLSSGPAPAEAAVSSAGTHLLGAPLLGRTLLAAEEEPDRVRGYSADPEEEEEPVKQGEPDQGADPEADEEPEKQEEPGHEAVSEEKGRGADLVEKKTEAEPSGGQTGGEVEADASEDTQPDCPPRLSAKKCELRRQRKANKAAKQAAREERQAAKKAKKCPKGPVGKKCRQKKRGIKVDRKKTRTKSIIKEEEIKCVTRTVTKEVAKSKDAEIHADAIADVFRLVCTEGHGVTVQDFDHIFKSQDAFAFARTISKSMVRCRGTERAAYKCYSVTASAKAYAEATAQAHVSAVSNAVSSCGCLTEAVADSIANTSLYLKLVAEAASTATAEVCVNGRGWVKDRAFESCVSKVYGKIFAEATAEAVVKGECLNAEAISNVLADISGEFDAHSTCGESRTDIEYIPPPGEEYPEEEPVTEGDPDAETEPETGSEEEAAA